MEKYDPLAINYKMDTLEDILSIPVPTEKFELPDDFMDSIEYVLQRKATEFKKEGDMECAIACLEKAVEIIPFSPMPYPDFIDNRGNIEKAAYEKYASEMRLKKETEKEYFWILKHLPRIAPKSLNGYSRMKNSNSKNFQKIRKMAMEKGLEFADTSKENISKKEILRTCWGDYEMPDPYILDIRKGPRYDLKKIKEDEL